MYTLRQFLARVFPFLGGILLLYSAIVLSIGWLQVAMFGLGFVIMIAGSWKLYNRLLPNQRYNTALRAEVDQFIGLVRDLNNAAICLEETPSKDHEHAFEAAQEAMHQSIDRMAGLAGKTGRGVQNKTVEPSSPVEA